MWTSFSELRPSYQFRVARSGFGCSAGLGFSTSERPLLVSGCVEFGSTTLKLDVTLTSQVPTI